MTSQLPPHQSGPPEANWDAIARFLAGESAPEEAAEIRKWIGQNSRDAQLVVSLDDVVSRIVKPNHSEVAVTAHRPLDVEGALKRAHTQLNFAAAAAAIAPVTVTAQRSAPGSRMAARVQPASPTRWLRIGLAAAATVVVALGVSQFRAQSNQGTQTIATYQTKVGVRDSVLLPDGSRVVLAPGSRLIVAVGYGNGQRTVELQGAGQFTVKHDADRPFIVRSGKAVITDLGTTFTVKTMATSAVLVMVTEGAVSLFDSTAGASKAIELRAGDRGRMNIDGSLAFERGSVTPDETAWVTGTLVYRDTPFAEVQADLRRWYGVELVVNDSTPIPSLTSSFDNEAAPLVLKKIAAYLGRDLTMHGDSAFIGTPRGRSKN